MQHRQYKVTTWPFNGKWNWNVTEKKGTAVLGRGNGCIKQDKAYSIGKEWIRLNREKLDGENDIPQCVSRKSFRRVYRPIA
jgi:hypothetical protein